MGKTTSGNSKSVFYRTLVAVALFRSKKLNIIVYCKICVRNAIKKANGEYTS